MTRSVAKRVARLPGLLVVTAIAVSGCTGADQPEPSLGPTTTNVAAHTRGWTRIAPSPLSARYDAVSVWVHGRFVMVGGFVDQVCPPSASCVSSPAHGQTRGRRYSAI